jgi:hypothetical protein
MTKKTKTMNKTKPISGKDYLKKKAKKKYYFSRNLARFPL